MHTDRWRTTRYGLCAQDRAAVPDLIDVCLPLAGQIMWRQGPLLAQALALLDDLVVSDFLRHELERLQHGIARHLVRLTSHRNIVSSQYIFI